MSDNAVRKWKRSLIYTKCGKVFEEELTYDKFIENIDSEFRFLYKNMIIDIAHHYQGLNKIYELNISSIGKEPILLEFDSVEQLVRSNCIEGKTIIEIWEYLEN